MSSLPSAIDYMVVYHERIQIGFKMSSKRQAQRIFGATSHETHLSFFQRILDIYG